jgi:hypothetical protein
MLSPEPWTVRSGGYPLLLQSGETYGGAPLVDRQHPHDLFMEVAALYTQGLGDVLALQLYAAPAGEPALGPAGFPHRLSAAPDPLAPIGHHWLDSTHISFGVVTAAVMSRDVKVEGSWFNGREPDERRWDFDLRAPDSWAVRAQMAASSHLTMQISYGWLASPERQDLDISVRRTTVSVTHHRPGAASGMWATTAAFGHNDERHAGESHGSFAALVESALDLDGRNVFFGRAEAVLKSGHDLAPDQPTLVDDQFVVGALSLGYLRTLGAWAGVVPGIGARATGNLLPDELRAHYGQRLAIGAIAYLRVAVTGAP